MKKLFTLIAAVLLIVACSEDITTNRPDGNRRNISFGVLGDDAVSVTIEDNITRSTAMPVLGTDYAPWTAELTNQQPTDVTEMVVEVESDFPTDEQLCLTITDEPRIHKDQITRGALQNMVDTRTLVFGVTEFVKDNTTSPVFSNKVPVVQNRTLDGGLELFLSNETWEDDAYNGTEYDFYAYAPQVANAGDKGITLSNNNRTISYDANDVEVGDQPDLMTARKATSAYVSLVPLTFQHRLCAIQIKTAGTWTAGYHVSGVQFTNVISSGTFDIDKDKDVAWTSKGTAGIYTVKGFNKAAATATVVTGDDDKWLMLPPQTLSSAKISITLTDDETETYSYTVTAPISAYTWTAGHTVTYTISPASIATMTVNYPTSWNNGGTPVDGPVTTYETADEFGLFVLDRDNKILVSNEPVSPTTGVAAASRTLNITNIFKSKQYKYYLMYPYRSDLATIVNATVATNYDNYYKVGATATGRTANADAFFTDVISNWTPAADQSAAADFKKQDLQIAVLSGSQFDMVHKMGLVELTLPYKALTQTRTDNNGTITNSGTVYKTASSQFASGTLTPYLYEDEGGAAGNNKTLYCLINNSATIASKATVADSWSQDVSAARGALSGYTINSSRTYWKYVGTYSNTGSPTTGGGYTTSAARGADNPSVTYTAKEPFTVSLESGNYLVQCWGAKGENYNATLYGGNGGYTSGNIFLPSRTLYIYTGNIYGYNGGGWTNGVFGRSGGGATDIRLIKGTAAGGEPNWKDWESRKSRIMVAGGGGGGGARQDGYGDGIGGYGGGLIAGNGTSEHHTNKNTYYNVQYGAGQDYGGYLMYYTVNSSGVASYEYTWYGGRFGYSNFDQINYRDQGSGAGGWYGGTAGGHSGTSGGSSYISGHAGCIAVTEDATEIYNEETTPKTYLSEISHRTDTDPIDKSTHYSGLKFTNTVMIDGAGYNWTTVRGSYVGTPKFSGSGVQAGNPDLVGYAKITTIPDD